MSEFQLYEFEAIDRPLTEEEQAAVSSLSRRVHPHPWRAVFVYDWSNLPADPRAILARYYDAMLYTASWGSRQLLFRFPLSALDVERVQAYCEPPIVEEMLSLSIEGEHAILNIELHPEEGGDWTEGKGGLSDMVGLRDDILHDDYRVMYLAWLRAVEQEDLHDSVVEPPVPPGLKALSGPLRAFIEFFGVDRALVRAAARASREPAIPSAGSIQAAVERLAQEERTSYLVRLAQGEPHLSALLGRRLRQATACAGGKGAPRRSVGELREAAQEIRRKVEARQARQKAEQYQREMDELAEYEGIHWAEIERLIGQKNARSYDEAVALLLKLKELARYQGENVAFAERIARLREQYARRPALLDRMGRAGLWPICDLTRGNDR